MKTPRFQNLQFCLREKVGMPRALHGDEWPLGVWGHAPPSRIGFFFGRSPDLWLGFFTHKVFKMLLSKSKITEDLVDMLMNWRHSGFNVFCGPRIQPGEEKDMENLSR